jgi:hypothetical protein
MKCAAYVLEDSTTVFYGKKGREIREAVVKGYSKTVN